jgi:UDP-glucose 4-epimerase
MKILVTGGAGFIGSHLIEALLEKRSSTIVSLDNYSTGKRENHLSGVEYIHGETKDIDELIQFEPDLVFHLGEYSRVEQSFTDLDKVWESNSLGTYNVLKFCLKNTSKIVYAGSSTKFGDGGLGRSQTPYGWTKAANTELVKCFGDWFGLEYAITYFYNVFGGREIRVGDYATLIGIFSECRKIGKPLPVVMPGAQKRNFTHIDDIVSGLLKVGENGLGDDFGIGSDESYSILNVAKLFGGEIEELPPRRGNRLSSDIDTSKTKALGWKCERSLEEYINSLKQDF